jgi:hypothetical protein
MPVIPALGRLRQEDLGFKACLVYIARPVSNKTKRQLINESYPKYAKNS